jgi:hypothetical protein
VPNEWKTSITVPIFKKGQKTNPDNYRGISLLCSALKLFTQILTSKLELIIYNTEEQQGFRKNRSTTDAIFIVRQIKEKAVEFNLPAFACFIDLTKAFDRARLSDIMHILTERGAPPEIVNAIGQLNCNTNTRIRVDGCLSNPVNVGTGIRQGDSLSPFLFNLIMDEIVGEIKLLRKGYRLGEQLIDIVCYADDAVIFAENEADLQSLLHAFNRASQKYNMIISVAKTKSLVFARSPINCNISVDGLLVEQVPKFRYLGVDLCGQTDLPTEIVGQINKAAAISGCLRNCIWKNPDMKISSKIKIYKTCVRPIMTYGIESRADTTITKNALRVSEMKTLRSIAGKTLRDRIRNTRVREICEVEDIVRWGRQRRRFWYAHVRRMDSSRLPTNLMEDDSQADHQRDR